MPMFSAGRWPALNRSVSRKIWPSVIEMTFVGMYADTSPAWVSMIGQRGQRAAAVLVVHARGALEQPGVEVEHVARVRLAARRAAQEQGHLAVGPGVLRQVVVDVQGVLDELPVDLDARPP